MTSKILITLALGGILFLCGLWLVGGSLSAPMPQSIGHPPIDLAITNVEFPSDSGAAIRGWIIPGEKGRGAVVLMHGVRATRLSMLERARFLARAGYTVLLFDFQSHGESGGEQITFGYLESKDARAAVNLLRSNYPGEKIGVIGVSMGGAASLLASPALDVNAMVLEMVYPSIDRAISNRLKMYIGDWAGVLTPLLTWQFNPRLGVSSDALRPIDHVGAINAPKLFIAGADDRHTTLEESRQLYDAASSPKELWVVDGATHEDLHAITATEYERRILDFFGRHLQTQN